VYSLMEGGPERQLRYSVGRRCWCVTHHLVRKDFAVRAYQRRQQKTSASMQILGRKEHPPNPLLKSVQVLHDDCHLAVLLKPEGVCTHGHGRGRTRKSLTHVISRIVSESSEHDRLPKPSPAHRLDKATGGIVTFVKTLRAAQGMQHSFENSRSVFKRCALNTIWQIGDTCKASETR
jgi:23S rRNA-/tRNA-specific pseudouridylate synthase